MDDLKKQIMELTDKVNSLYQVVELLSKQMQDSWLENQGKKGAESFPKVESVKSYSQSHRSSADLVMEHKDILVDRDGWGSNSEQNYDTIMSPEIQIRRLTAQLTAAYNRIAALEEQLLSNRIHS